MFRKTRIALTLLATVFKKSTGGPLDSYELTLRTWPWDLDVKNVNQSVYLFYAELGRWQWIFGSGLNKTMKHFGCLPITATQMIRHLKPLKRFEKFTVKTRLSHWDDKWLYLDQSLVRGDELIAVVTIKGLFKSSDGNISTATLLKQGGHDLQSPPLPPRFSKLAEIEDDAIKDTKS